MSVFVTLFSGVTEIELIDIGQSAMHTPMVSFDGKLALIRPSHGGLSVYQYSQYWLNITCISVLNLW